MIKETNLEKYYYYKGVQLKPFEALNEGELLQLECSEGFRKYLRMKNWNYYIAMITVLGLIILTAYLSNN